MKRSLKGQIAVLCGILGFFTGGLLNSGREIMDIMLGAAVGWGIVFFITYIGLEVLFPSVEEKNPLKAGAGYGPSRDKTGGIKKGIKIDYTSNDDLNFEDIYKLKK